MRSAPHGVPISGAEVTSISFHGFWLLIGERELLVPFDEFPWFREARVADILNVRLEGPDHLYWPDLDVDLSVASIEHPERFPLLSKGGSPRAGPPRKATRRKRASRGVGRRGARRS
jgi:hypothetical protein